MRVLSPLQREQFDEEGYVVADGVLDPVNDLAPILCADCKRVLDRISQALFRTARIRSTYDSLPFTARLVQICVESGLNLAQEFDITLPQSGIKLDTPIHVQSGHIPIAHRASPAGPRGRCDRAGNLLKPHPTCAHEAAQTCCCHQRSLQCPGIPGSLASGQRGNSPRGRRIKNSDGMVFSDRKQD